MLATLQNPAALVAAISVVLALVGGVNALPTALATRGEYSLSRSEPISATHTDGTPSTGIESTGPTAPAIIALKRRAGANNGPGDNSGDVPGSDNPGSGGDDSGDSGSDDGNGGKAPGKAKGHKKRDDLEARDMANLLGGVAPGVDPVTAKPHKDKVTPGPKSDSYGRRDDLEARGDLPAGLPYPFPPINIGPKSKSQGGRRVG